MAVTAELEGAISHKAGGSDAAESARTGGVCLGGCHPDFAAVADWREGQLGAVDNLDFGGLGLWSIIFADERFPVVATFTRCSNELEPAREISGVLAGLRDFGLWGGGGIQPARVLMIADQREWLETTPHAAWLPHSISTSFWPMNVWRALLMITPAWLATCAAWAGSETEQAWQRLLGAAAVNGLLLASFGIIQRLAGAPEMFWFYVPQSSNGDQTFFGSFVYAGHAAAWMVLAFGAAAAMMDRHLRQRDPLAPPARWAWPALSAWIWLAALAVVVVALALFVKPDFWLLASGGVMVIYAWLWLRRWWLEGQKRRAALYALPALVFMAGLLGLTTGAAWWWRQGGSGASLQVNPQDASLPSVMRLPALPPP